MRTGDNTKEKTLSEKLFQGSIVKCSLVVLTLLMAADALVTNLLIEFDIAHEGNPLLSELAGGTGLIIVKTVAALACAAILWDIYKRHPRLGALSAYSLTSVYAIIVSWNLFLLLTPMTIFYV